MARRWHIEHEDGRNWTFDELLGCIRRDREHDGLWPADAGLFAMTTSDDSSVYLLDNCQTWHWLDDDVRVVWDD